MYIYIYIYLFIYLFIYIYIYIYIYNYNYNYISIFIYFYTPQLAPEFDAVHSRLQIGMGDFLLLRSTGTLGMRSIVLLRSCSKSSNLDCACCICRRTELWERTRMS